MRCCDRRRPAISRAHAALERVAGAWVVSDSGLSRNGTFVNGERLLAGHRLVHGDLLRLGDTVLQYRSAVLIEQELTTRTGRAPVRLSGQQRAVLLALCRPRRGIPPATNQQTCEELYLSVETVKDYLKQLFRLFGVADLPPNRKRAQLMRAAREAGLG